MIDFSKKPYKESELNAAFTRAKISVFVGKAASFLATIMSNLKFEWNDTDVTVARVNGTRLWINPDVFMSIHSKERQMLILHELWHIARMHSMREEGREHDTWNKACDIVINNMLYNQGYDIDSLEGFRDETLEGKSEEEIYIHLLNSNDNNDEENKLKDLSPCKEEHKKQLTEESINILLKGKMAALQQDNVKLDEIESMFGLAHADGSLTNILSEFFKRKVQWELLLRRYLNDVGNKNIHTWSRRNRRYPNNYLPGIKEVPNKLEHLIFFLDVSASITRKQAKRFNSEVKYIKETFNPKHLTVVQFDTDILDEKTFNESDRFRKVKIVEGAGTSYECVGDYLEKYKPTCGVIFTDLECTPMRKIKIPTLWIGVDTNDYRCMPIQGKTILIEDK